MRVAHGITALGIIAIFLALHLLNHFTFILGPDTYRAVMKVTRNVYRQGFLQPLLIALFLFQVGSGVCLATHSDVLPMDRFHTFQIASGIFLAAYVLGHTLFVFARLDLGIDSDCIGTDSSQTPRWREMDSNLYGAFPVKWCFSVYCQFFVRRCVQVRLACSAGDSPAGVKVRAP